MSAYKDRIWAVTFETRMTKTGDAAYAAAQADEAMKRLLAAMAEPVPKAEEPKA